MSAPAFEDLSVGQIVATRELSFGRSTLVKYAGASGDFNPIHWNDAFAAEVGLDGVIAHGMLTMGASVSVVEDWIGDQRQIVDYQTRFARPILVPNPGEAQVIVTATVGNLNEAERQARIDLATVFNGVKVLAKAQVVVQF